MFSFDELAPSVPDVYGVVVVGTFVNEDTKVVVTCVVGILIEKLDQSVSDR